MEDLNPLFDLGAQLGERLMPDLVRLLTGPPRAYSKAAIVGALGELEHGHALVHPRLGKPMRAAIGGGKAVICSNVKVPGQAPRSICRFPTRTMSGHSRISAP